MNYNADARLRAISMNAVREAMLVQNRWDKPFSDDDAARMHDIFLLLHLDAVHTDNEHAALTTPAPVSEQVLKIADLLENAPEPAVNAVVPKSRAAKQ
jgi:hypothetical protein